jgi:hypothetical protein
MVSKTAPPGGSAPDVDIQIQEIRSRREEVVSGNEACSDGSFGCFLGGEDRQFKFPEEGNMRKGFLMVLVVALVAVLAAPAMAGTDINGFYRAKGYVTNFDLPSAPSITDDMQSGAYVEQRFRVRFAFGEENVKVVWFSEIDFSSWGDSAGSAAPGGAARNVGGALGGDKVNLETKNVYVWFKLPNTSLDFTVGLQNQTDTFQGLLYGGADMAGIFMTGKYEPVNWKLGLATLYENNPLFADDTYLVTFQLGFPLSKDLKLGGSLYYLRDDSQKYAGTLPGVPAGLAANTKEAYTIGLDAAWNAGPFALSGFFLYQFGTIDFISSATQDIDISAYAGDVRLDVNLGPGKLFVEGLAISGSDTSNSPGSDYESVVTLSDVNASPGGNSAFTRMDYQILMGNADDINQNTCLIGCAGAVGGAQSPGNGGRGLWTIGAGYSMKVAEKTTVKIGAGYLAAMKMLSTDPGFRDKDMGAEINGNVNYNIMKGLDVGFYAAYAFLGDFYKPTASTDPDDVYTMFLRLNYAF